MYAWGNGEDREGGRAESARDPRPMPLVMLREGNWWHLNRDVVARAGAARPELRRALFSVGPETVYGHRNIGCQLLS